MARLFLFLVLSLVLPVTSASECPEQTTLLVFKLWAAGGGTGAFSRVGGAGGFVRAELCAAACSKSVLVWVGARGVSDYAGSGDTSLEGIGGAPNGGDGGGDAGGGGGSSAVLHNNGQQRVLAGAGGGGGGAYYGGGGGGGVADGNLGKGGTSANPSRAEIAATPGGGLPGSNRLVEDGPNENGAGGQKAGNYGGGGGGQGGCFDDNVVSCVLINATSTTAVADEQWLFDTPTPGAAAQDGAVVIEDRNGTVLASWTVPGVYLFDLPTPCPASKPNAADLDTAVENALQKHLLDAVRCAMSNGNYNLTTATCDAPEAPPTTSHTAEQRPDVSDDGFVGLIGNDLHVVAPVNGTVLVEGVDVRGEIRNLENKLKMRAPCNCDDDSANKFPSTCLEALEKDNRSRALSLSNADGLVRNTFCRQDGFELLDWFGTADSFGLGPGLSTLDEVASVYSAAPGMVWTVPWGVPNFPYPDQTPAFAAAVLGSFSFYVSAGQDGYIQRELPPNGKMVACKVANFYGKGGDVVVYVGGQPVASAGSGEVLDVKAPYNPGDSIRISEENTSMATIFYVFVLLGS